MMMLKMFMAFVLIMSLAETLLVTDILPPPPLPPSPKPCPIAWSEFNQNCYKYFEMKKTKDAAEAYCVTQQVFTIIALIIFIVYIVYWQVALNLSLWFLVALSQSQDQ